MTRSLPAWLLASFLSGALAGLVLEVLTRRKAK